MRVAILISGYLRSFEENLQNIKNKILDRFDSPDIYLHITKNEDTEDKYFNKVSNLTEKIKYQLNPLICIIESNLIFSEKNSKKNNLYNQWIKYYKLNNLKKINEKIFGKYDLVIKLRPDLFFNSEINFEISKNTIFLPEDSKIDKKKLLNCTDNYIADTFAFGDSESMDIYFDVFESLNLECSEHGFTPETILFEYLKNKVSIKKLNINYYILLSKCNVFAICGDSGSGKTTLGNLLKKYFDSSFLLECDRYHKWERNDENWSEFTHLNPEANFISKMNEDIFNLKVGKTIYQVDYDHNTGKFTQKEKIENSENLIVCGLHTLYKNSDSVYNLKIFMDTEESLKKEWKIQRDVSKRGYSEEKVLNQIEFRKNDYLKYIEPQKNNSDIIINFYKDDESEQKLRIYILRKFDYVFFIEDLKQNNIDFNFEKNSNFVIFEFYKYVDNNIFNKLMFRSFDFYDYILYFILNVSGK